MRKRDFLKRGASLVGSATLLGSAFVQECTVNAGLYENMLSTNRKYVLAKILAFFWLTSWKKSIEKETKEKAFLQLKEDLMKMVLQNFDTFPSSSEDQPDLLKNFSLGGKDGFFVKSEPIDSKSFALTLLNKNGSNNGATELLRVRVSLDNLDKVQKFYDTIDYMVTAAKLEKLCKNSKDLFKKEDGIDGSSWYCPQKSFFVQGRKVESICTPFNAQVNKYGFLGQCSITLEGRKIIYRQGLPVPTSDRHLCLLKMTKYMKEIIEQVEEIESENADRSKYAKKAKYYTSLLGDSNNFD